MGFREDGGRSTLARRLALTGTATATVPRQHQQSPADQMRGFSPITLTAPLMYAMTKRPLNWPLHRRLVKEVSSRSGVKGVDKFENMRYAA